MAQQINPEFSIPRRGDASLKSIDVGCGPIKKKGAIGLDIRPLDNVDHVVDFTRDRLPFDDDSVGDIFSAHCIEHLPDPVHLFREMTRVATHGARIELWLPYGWHDDAFLWDHKTVLNEEWFMHICHTYFWFWQSLLGARWWLNEVVFWVERSTMVDFGVYGVDIAFALKYMKNIAREMGLFIEVDKRSLVCELGQLLPSPPPRFYAYRRDLA